MTFASYVVGIDEVQGRTSVPGCFYTSANAKKNTISIGNAAKPHLMAPTPILQYNYHLSRRYLAVAVATSLFFQAEYIKKPRRRLIKLYNEIIRIIRGFRFLTTYKAKRDLVVIESENIHGEGRFINDVILYNLAYSFSFW